MSRCALVVRMSCSSISWHMDGSLPVRLARWDLDRLSLRAAIRLLSLTDGPKLLPYQYVVVHGVGLYKGNAPPHAMHHKISEVGFRQIATGNLKGSTLY